MEEKKEWYVVNTYSGHEQKVKEKLEAKIDSMGLQDHIYRIIIHCRQCLVPRRFAWDIKTRNYSVPFL